MEYKCQTSDGDFRVKYTLVVPESHPSGYQLSEEEKSFLKELDGAYDEIERLTNHADGYDYALSVSSGIIAGLIDSFFVGEWDFYNAKKQSNIAINNKIINFAKKDPRYIPWCKDKGKNGQRKPRDPERLLSAVVFLEDHYELPGDNNWKFEGSGISASSHHLDDFCHHPTLIGLICSILVQFTGTAKYSTKTGETLRPPVDVNDYGNLVSSNTFGKVFAGIINWFFKASQTIKNQKGHLMSDMAGSKTAVKAKKAGAGVPETIMSTLKELSALPCFKDTNFAENLRKAYQNGIGTRESQLNLGIFNNLFEGANSKFDMRTEGAVVHELNRQKIPVIINEIIVRSFYFVRRFIEQMKVKKNLFELEWKKLLPMNNRTIVRMITIASGVFTVFDLADAGIRAGVKSGGELVTFAKYFILRVNFVGIGRFTIAVGVDVYMGIRKGRLEIAVMSGEIAVTAIETKSVIVETSKINAQTDEKISRMRESIAEVQSINKLLS